MEMDDTSMIEKAYFIFQIPISNGFVLNNADASKFAAETGDKSGVMPQLITKIKTYSSGFSPMTSGDRVVAKIEMGSTWCMKKEDITQVKMMVIIVRMREISLMLENKDDKYAGNSVSKTIWEKNVAEIIMIDSVWTFGATSVK
jgi:hypothetical protein